MEREKTISNNSHYKGFCEMLINRFAPGETDPQIINTIISNYMMDIFTFTYVRIFLIENLDNLNRSSKEMLESFRKYSNNLLNYIYKYTSKLNFSDQLINKIRNEIGSAIGLVPNKLKEDEKIILIELMGLYDGENREWVTEHNREQIDKIGDSVISVELTSVKIVDELDNPMIDNILMDGEMLLKVRNILEQNIIQENIKSNFN